MIYVAQAIMILYAWVSAKQEASVIVLFRDYVPQEASTKMFHVYGWYMTAIVGLSFMLCQKTAVGKTVVPFLCALCYWIVFDVSLNLSMGWGWNYVGQSSAVDRFFITLFGNDAPNIKFFFSVTVLCVLNYLFIRLNKPKPKYY
jgi:hypothetical protein